MSDIKRLGIKIKRVIPDFIKYVITFGYVTYMRSPCIRRWPGGGFQAEVVKTFKQANLSFKVSLFALVAICSGNRGRSVDPGRM